ncbi:hypothetical protein [Hyphococcus sp.]|uniref:hypothetical protein n=1 Tax=Hyphococcus sp. TaxID=2038636 RepID=UPI0035C7818C
MRPFAFLLLALTAACGGEKETPEAAGIESMPGLEKLWVADGFSAPEGVAAAPRTDDGRDLYFISNVAGEPDGKDDEGWISILSEGGEIVTEKFAEGMNAPKGMAVLGGRLYVTDIDQVLIFDIESGEPLGAVEIDRAQFLNDMTVWQGGIFVSDSGAGKIHRIDGDQSMLWLEDDRLGGVNGVLGDGDTLYIATMASGSLYAADTQGTLTEIATGMKNADGIGLVSGGGWLVSSFPGVIYYVSPEGEAAKLVDTREDGVLQNDLTMFGDLVIVPNWNPGTVTAWKIRP